VSESFRTSDDYAEEAHQLYIAGRYDAALSLLREALDLFPLSPELHVGMGYARLAREEYAWALRSFREATGLEPDQEDALAGLGETLIKLGQRADGLACFERIRQLGYGDDHDLMLQVGRALFREGLLDHARRQFESVVERHPDSSEAAACLGYAAHRLGDDAGALLWLRQAIDLNPDDVEAHIYLGNLLYDRGEYNDALYHFGRTVPGDHIEELAIWRLIELRKSIYRLGEDDPELRPWTARLRDLARRVSADDRLLAEIEGTMGGAYRDPRQLDFFGTALTELQGMKKRAGEMHGVALANGATYAGTWDDIVLQMKQDDRDWAGRSVADYMAWVARDRRRKTGVRVPTTDAESFLRGIAAAGMLRIMG